MMPISSLRRRRRNLCKQIELSSADAIAGMQKCINTWENTLENHWTEKIHFQFNLYTYVGIRRTFLSLFYIVYKKKKKGCINSRIYICYFTTFRIIIATFCVRRAPPKNLKSSKFVREMLRRLKEKVEVPPKEYHDFKILIFQQKYVPWINNSSVQSFH